MGVTPKRQLEATGKSKGWSRSSCVAHLLPFPNHIWQHEDRLLKWPELMSPEHRLIWYFQPMAVRYGDSYEWALIVCFFNCFNCQFKPMLKWENTWWANNREQFVPVIIGVLWGQWLRHAQPYGVYLLLRLPCARLERCCLATATVREEITHMKTEVAKFKPCCFFNNALIDGTGQFTAHGGRLDSIRKRRT